MTTLTEPARDHDLISVQCLRGVAAMMVVCFHCFPQLARMGYSGNQHLSLSSGVDIFFVISGFIMLVSARRSPSRGPGAFLVNRAIRILPIYWMLTSAMVAFALFMPQLMNSTRFELAHVVKSYLMIPAPHPVLHLYWPILIPGWTLNYEMFFYLIFALGLWLVADRGRGLSMFVGAVITGLVLVRLVLPTPGLAGVYTDSVILEFVLGLVAAELFLAGHRIPVPAGMACLGLGAGLLLLSDYVPYPDIRGLCYGIPAFLIFVGAVFAPWTQAGGGVRFLRIVGDASYSIYLTHMITMAAAGQGWKRLIGGSMSGSTILFILFAMTVCALGGMAFYRLVELPLTNRLKAMTRRTAVRRVPASA